MEIFHENKINVIGNGVVIDPVIFKEEIEKLKEYKTLLGIEEYIHSYPHSWRSKAPLVYKNTSQWFISMEKNDLRKIFTKEAIIIPIKPP